MRARTRVMLKEIFLHTIHQQAVKCAAAAETDFWSAVDLMYT